MSVNSPPEHSVLIVTSDFPPLAGTNTQRVQSFVRHLPTFGWRSAVVTQAIEDMELMDSRDLDRLPTDLSVIRVPSPDPFRWYRRRKGARPVDVASRTSTPGVSTSHATISRTTAADLAKAPLRAASRLAKRGLRRYWYVPDPLMPWGDAAARASIELLARSRFDCLLTSAPSYSSHVAGLKIKKRTNIPWIADFRDLWVGRPYRALPFPAHEKIDVQFEAAVMEHADRIIVASAPWRDVFRERYGDHVADRTEVITNGFEISGPWPPPRKETTAGQVVIAYTGVMEGAESPAPFLRALLTLLQQRPSLEDRVRVRFIGPGAEVEGLQAMVAGAGLADRIAFLGVRPHAECLVEQERADVLLLLSGEKHVQTIRGKSFEYMATGKPILAIIPERGIQAELLREAGTALIVSPSDGDGIVRALHALIEGDAAKSLRPNWDYIRQFDRKVLAEKLAGILLACAQGRESSPPSGSRLAA
jgi:glycosyltransferase involved in cell wall biosynthesis